jgi:cellobiose dehydrogenase (acceptor)
MTITQYLGTGSKSRGRMVITNALNTRVATSPYLNDAADKAAVIKGLENVQKYFQPISNLTWIRPAAGQTAEAYVNSVSHHAFDLFPSRFCDFAFHTPFLI